MRITTFASGSSGNCALISSGKTHLLMDAGISMKRILCGLNRQGLDLSHIHGILITHEHSDHIQALPMLIKNHHPDIYAPRTVANALLRRIAGAEDCVHIIPVGEAFSLDNFRITAFPTPHDTDESVGYRLEDGVRFGFCTDTGHVSEEMIASLCGCDSVVIEANHDVELLLAGRYPYPLKKRILDPNGHLSNDDCAGLACLLAENGTRQITLGHLSKENNRPALARDTVRRALDDAGFAAVELRVAAPDGDVSWEVGPC